MKFGYTIIYVNDVEETIYFYEKAFGFKKKFITPEKDYGELLSGETTVSFASVDLAKSNLREDFQVSDQSNRAFGIELAFVTNRINVDFERALREGAIEVSPVTSKPWGQKVGYVKDINGILIEICTPVN